MKRALVLLIAGTVLSGVAAAYAASARPADTVKAGQASGTRMAGSYY